MRAKYNVFCQSSFGHLQQIYVSFLDKICFSAYLTELMVFLIVCFSIFVDIFCLFVFLLKLIVFYEFFFFFCIYVFPFRLNCPLELSFFRGVFLISGYFGTFLSFCLYLRLNCLFQIMYLCCLKFLSFCLSVHLILSFNCIFQVSVSQ